MHHIKVCKVFIFQKSQLVLILQPPSETCSESSKTSEMKVSTNPVHNSKLRAHLQKAPPQYALNTPLNIV